MKKQLSLLLILALLLSLLGCNSESYDDPGHFYYKRTQSLFEGSEGIIAPEVREMKDLRGNTERILQTYLQGPQSDDLESPIPRDTEILEWKMIHSSLHINFSSSFAQLSGVDLTIACACIAKTCMELTDAKTVRIRADGVLLNGSTYVVINEENLKLEDDSLDQLRTELTLYYTDSQRRYLIGHNVSVNLAAQDNVEAYLVEQLITAPEGLGLVSPLPSGTKLLSCRVSDGLCRLDLSKEFDQNAFSQSYAQRTTLFSLVNTLTQLEDVDRVEFYLEGSLMARYQELTISKALVFDESIIGPVRTGMNEYDATLYLANGSELYLAAVPVRIRAAVGITQAEQVVNEILRYQNENGFYSTVPADTVLNSISVNEGLCTIDLSRHFIEETEHLLLSVHSLVASVCALDGIHAALITVDGSRPEGEFGDLFLPATPSSDWYL